MTLEMVRSAGNLMREDIDMCLDRPVQIPVQNRTIVANQIEEEVIDLTQPAQRRRPRLVARNAVTQETTLLVDLTDSADIPHI